MRAAATSLARVARLRVGLACRGIPSRRISRPSFSAASSASSAPQKVVDHDVRRLPRERASHGPTYVFGTDTRLRFLGFHGCGSRFTVLFREGADVGFDAGELELDELSEKQKRTWRVRTAKGPPEGVTVPALEGFSGEILKQLALYDEDFGDQRLYKSVEDGEVQPRVEANNADSKKQTPRKNVKKWSAKTAAPSWPSDLCEALDSNGGVSGVNTLMCVDGGYFLELTRLSAFPHPVLFPHGAWRVEKLGPASFHKLAKAIAPLDATRALHYAARGAVLNDALRDIDEDSSKHIIASTPGRVTGEIPGRGRVNLGDSAGDSGLATALDSVSDRTVAVSFPEGPLGLGFAPSNWDEGTSASVVEVDENSVAAKNGVTTGMTFQSVSTKRKKINNCSNVPFDEIDASFDLPRPIEVTFVAKPPGVERLYAVEMRARDVAAGAMESNDESFHEPGAVLPSVVWREEPSTIFVGDPGSGTPPHHDIVAQIELCHVISGTKLLAAAPWGEASDALMKYAKPGGDDDDDDTLLTVPTHRALSAQERKILETQGLCVVHARPGDTVAFSSAAAHFAVNGMVQPCAANFHGVLTPASMHTLVDKNHFHRLDPFSQDELESDGFGEHLTGRAVLTEELSDETIKLVKRRDLESEKERQQPSYAGDRLSVTEIGSDAAAVLSKRFEETTRAMAAAREAAESDFGPEEWPESSRSTFFI